MRPALGERVLCLRVLLLRLGQRLATREAVELEPPLQRKCLDEVVKVGCWKRNHLDCEDEVREDQKELRDTACRRVEGAPVEAIEVTKDRTEGGPLS